MRETAPRAGPPSLISARIFLPLWLACPGLESQPQNPRQCQRCAVWPAPVSLPAASFSVSPALITYGIGVGKVLVREGRRFPSKARKGGWEGDERRYETGSHEQLALGMYWRERNLKKVSGKELYAGVLSGGRQREGQGCSHQERKEQTWSKTRTRRSAWLPELLGSRLGGQSESEASGPVWVPSINTGSRLTCPLSRESAGLEFHCLE